MTSLSSKIATISGICGENQKKRYLKTGTLSAKAAVGQLLDLSKALKSTLNLDNNLYSVNISYGYGFFPKVPWVGITKKGTRVSDSVSVCICFSNNGKGIVCGAMYFTRKTSGPYPTIVRSVEDNLRMPLRGGSNKTTYANKFFNPAEFEVGKFEDNDLISHMKKSIELMEIISTSKLVI